jgi:flagellar motor component MotA
MATTKLKTTCGELVDLLNGLFSVQDIPGKEFALIVSNNMNALQESLKHVEEAGRPSEEFTKFAQEMARLQQINDSEGLKELEKSNSELIAERKLQMEKIQEILKSEAEVKLDVITKDLLPSNATAKQINNLEKIII